MKLLSILSLLTSTGLAYDCAPKTFTTLTHLILEPTREEEWSQTFFSQGKKSPSLQETINIWNTKKPNFKLEVVYSLADALETKVFKVSITKGVPYYWVGFPSKETNNPDTNDLHACIAYFNSSTVTLVTTVSIKEIENKPLFTFLIETISIEELANRTVYIFNLLPHGKNTKLRSLTSLLDLQIFEVPEEGK